MRYCVAIVVLATLAAFVWAADIPAFKDPAYVARYLDQHAAALTAAEKTALEARIATEAQKLEVVVKEAEPIDIKEVK